MNTPVGPNMNKQYREVSRCSTGPRVMHTRPHCKAENVKAQRTPTLRVEHGEGRTTRRAPPPYPDPAVTYYSFPPGGFRSPPNLVANFFAMVVCPFGAEVDGVLLVRLLDRFPAAWASASPYRLGWECFLGEERFGSGSDSSPTTLISSSSSFGVSEACSSGC